MNKIGIIHISATSIRLVVYEIEEMGFFKKIDELKTPFDICYDINSSCEINKNNLDLLSATITTYESLCFNSDVNKIITIATQSFNLISNKHHIIDMLKTKFNIDLKILSYYEEIYYGYLGSIKSFTTDNSLLIEINAASTNIAWLKANKIHQYATLPFGGNNLTHKFNTDNRILSDSLLKCLAYIKKHLEEISWINEDSTFDSIILIGDIATNISKIVKLKKRYPFDNYSKFEVSEDDIDELYNLVKSLDIKKRSNIAGLDLEMTSTFFSSLAIFNSLIKRCNLNKIFLSNSSLREGVLYENLLTNFSVNKDNLEYSIYGILNSLNCNIKHAEQVFWITKKLYEQLKPLHNLDESYMNILKTGSMLHDVGNSINYQHHHNHSFYIILNSSINELSQKELLMSAALAASHRFNNYNISLCQYSSILSKLDMLIIDKIGVLLKIAEGLDRSLISTVQGLETSITEDTVEINLTSQNNLDVEIHQALRAKNYFKNIFNKDLIIRKK